MYFKKLEIVGFKSFLNKTNLKFEPGVTAIVGPNGCGKSNIVDAVKWVLGEQSSKSMRSSSMQDVIFNGTDKQDPVNVAEVSLTLSNEDRSLPLDYDEVVISRRLYRSGESEYLLNKTPVRLADVRNILMGTGMGTSSYSIVEQGRMDMILSSKPEERRYVFEEASGITRYKTKKREAMLKLERTQENLTRINDIITEVERQIKDIERKARKAERYKVQYEELKALDIKFTYNEFITLGKSDTSVRDIGNRNRELAEHLEKELAGLETALNREREEYNAIWQDIANMQNEIMQLGHDIDKSEHIIRVNTERIGESERNIEKLKEEIENLSKRKDSLREGLQNLEVRFSDISAKRQEKENEVISFQGDVDKISADIESHKHELRMNREKTIDIASEETQSRNALIKVRADSQNSQARIKRLRMEQHNVETEKENVHENLKRIEEETSFILRELEEKREDFRRFNEEYSSRQHEFSGLNKEKIEKEKRINEIKPRRQFLEKLVSEKEGINEGVKELLRLIESGERKFEGVHGILSDLVSVGEGFEESLAFVLAEASQALVVDNISCVKEVSAYLKEHSAESVSFIILDELLNPGKNRGIRIPNGFSDVARILTAKEPYKKALNSYLENTVVSGEETPDSKGFSGRIIGKKGEVRSQGFKRSRNFSDKDIIPLFGRKEKAAELRAEEDKVRKEIDDLEKTLNTIEEWLKTSSEEKGILETALRKKEADYSDISSKKAVIKGKYDSLEEELLVLGTEIEEEREENRCFQQEEQRLIVVVENLEKEASLIKEAMEQAQVFIQESSHKREEILFRMSDSKAELSALKKEEENISYNLERENQISSRISQETEWKELSVKENAEKIEKLKEENIRSSQTIDENKIALEARNNEIAGKRQKKDSISEIIREKERDLNVKEDELETARNKSRDLDIQKKELEYKRGALVTRIRDTYKVDLNSVNVEIEENIDWEEAKERLEELKGKLERMGDVSLSAVEEHKELEQRYHFLTKHRDDLTESRESLLKAIAKINRTTRKLFMETFEAVKKEFNDYFRMLFNGGRAEIILEDETNILECGIDIIVRPPGKKLHNIMQLSGGEKAMTAIALIFAIFKVNPSPFCVLDEIDAPLDESNIVRFCRVLQEFLKLSQFIIVTHNRMTIQLADVLYGITMEQKGISKIVSVKFTEETDTPEQATEPVAI